MSVGTIMSDMQMQVQLLSGGRLGTVEESFLSRLNPGEEVHLLGESTGVCAHQGYDRVGAKGEERTGRGATLGRRPSPTFDRAVALYPRGA